MCVRQVVIPQLTNAKRKSTSQTFQHNLRMVMGCIKSPTLIIPRCASHSPPKWLRDTAVKKAVHGSAVTISSQSRPSLCLSVEGPLKLKPQLGSFCMLPFVIPRKFSENLPHPLLCPASP